MPAKKKLEEHCPFCKAEKIGTRHYRLNGIELKQCTSCGRWKDPQEFTTSPPTNPDKLTSWCKECRSVNGSARAKFRRQNDPEYLEKEREKNRAYFEKYNEDPEFRKKRAEGVKKSRAKKPEYYAQYAQNQYEKKRQLRLAGNDEDNNLAEQ